MSYVILNNTALRQDSFELRPIARDDIFDIRLWRNAQMAYLRQKQALSEADQMAYYENVLRPEFEKQQPCPLLLTYFYKGKRIGYGGLVHIQWAKKVAEVSFLLAPEHHETPFYATAFATYLTLIQQLAKKHSLTLQTETYNLRPLHLATLEQAGFHLYKTLPNAIDKHIDICFHEWTIES
ncbi:MAG: hypothetical protein A2Y14_02850 [Verrucomicrobia bacterium GWF2_51_19]|nr:MAG: hypothetical protein A2Y14_02850 [Verrucomicrobia bacterium GWF2_51_19]HCJ11832.1 GNAT family N-acetyltransferase [Opitutae bacterium]